MSVLQDAVTTQSLIPRASQSVNLPAKAAKAALMFRKFNGNNQSNIDYSQYIPKHGTTDQQFLDKYRLVAYLKENWLSHTKDFTRESRNNCNIGELFENLLFKKQLTFSFIPWEKFSFGDCARIAPLCWAVAENHLPLLEKVLANDEGTFHYIGEACLLFWNTIEFHEVGGRQPRIEISNRNFKVLENRSLENVSSKTDCLFWLYSQMLIACRQGNTEIVNTCVGCIDRSNATTAFVGIRALPTFWSLVLSHLQLEATIHGHFMLVKEFQTDERFQPWISYESNGTHFNSLERAITLPCHEITDYLLTKSCPVSYRAKLVAIENVNLPDIIRSRDLTTLKRLLEFIDKSDGMGNASPLLFEIDEQIHKENVRQFRHQAIKTAAASGLCDSLNMILRYHSASAYSEQIIERNIAFVAAIESLHLHVVDDLLLFDHYRHHCYWLKQTSSQIYDQGSNNKSIIEYTAVVADIPEELRLSILNAICDVTEKVDKNQRLPRFERSDWILTEAIVKNKPERVIFLGGRKHFNHRYECLASNLADLLQEVEEYLWPCIHEHAKPKTTIPLIWAVIYNRPEVVKALLSEPLPSYNYDVIEVATTCAIMLDSVEILMLLGWFQKIINHGLNTVVEGRTSNFFLKRDLLDRVFAQGRYHGANPHLKVARRIQSWDHDHRKHSGPYSPRMRLLQEYLEELKNAGATIAEDEAFEIFASAETINTPSDKPT